MSKFNLDWDSKDHFRKYLHKLESDDNIRSVLIKRSPSGNGYHLYCETVCDMSRTQLLRMRLKYHDDFTRVLNHIVLPYKKDILWSSKIINGELKHESIIYD